MKKAINLFLISLVTALGCVFTSCNDEETTLSRAVLSSADVLVYDAIPSGPQLITVTSDADWVSECPDWVTISPSSGHAGQTEVEVSVSKNFRENAIDNPRKAVIKFKGRNLISIASVIIRQDGDKFRDPVDYTIETMEAAEDETVVRLTNMIVTALTEKGFVLTDGNDYAFVKESPNQVSVGDKVTVVGEKFTDGMRMAYIIGGKITNEGTASVPEKTPVDITATLDNTNGKKYQYVTLTGDFDGTAITVGEMTCKAYFMDAAQGFEVNKLGGHKVKVTGYFAGMASPVVNIIPTEIEDLGVNEIIYFFDDFEWLAPWAAAGKNGNGSPSAGDTIGDNNESAESPQISAKGMVVDGITAEKAMLGKGYSFYRVTPDSDNAGECIYLNKNYLKFGKTGYQAGICFPSIDVPSGESVAMEFDWSVQRKGNGNFDPVTLYVLVDNNGTETEFDIPTHTFAQNDAFKWIHATVDLSSVTISKDTKISLKQRDWKLTTANRWFLDNVKFKQTK